MLLRLEFCSYIILLLEVCENPKYRVESGTWKFRESRIYRGSRKNREFPKELGFGKGFGTSLNNSLKPMASTVSKGRRSRTIIRAIPSVISFGLTIFRVSFCTCDKFYIDSVSFLVHVLMFGCICFKWRDKPVVFAYLVWNSWWQCAHSAFVSSFSWKCSQTELLYFLPLHDIFCTTSCYHNLTLTITRHWF